MIGERSRLSPDIAEAVCHLEEATKDNTGITFIIAINYGSRDEIVRGVKRLAGDVAANRLSPDDVNEGVLQNYLDTADIPDPDLLIRTSGEERLSNFLLWQLAYTEFYFTDICWPDFNKEELEKAIDAYNHRTRRFGGLKKGEE